MESKTNEHLLKMKNVQKSILDYIEDENIEIGIATLKEILSDLQIYELRATLHLLVKLSNNYHRTATLYTKIEKVIKYLQSSILQNFTNFEIFNIFKSNKRILLFLFQEQIVIPDISIASVILSVKNIERNYPEYFYPEFQSYFKKLKNKEKFTLNKVIQFYENNSDDFEQKRKKGENDNYICTLIQNDSLDEFIQFVSKTNINLNSTIKHSIFETNSFLLDKSPTLIEYSAFYGSIKIFNYLILNKIELTDSILMFAIHSNNAEIINKIEERKDGYKKEFIIKLFLESIKCHHIEISDYIQTNYLNDVSIFNDMTFFIKNYNFMFIPNEIDKIDNEVFTFYYMCKYDYLSIVKSILNNNQKLILNSNDIPKKFFCLLQSNFFLF